MEHAKEISATAAGVSGAAVSLTTVSVVVSIVAGILAAIASSFAIYFYVKRFIKERKV